MQDKAQKVGDHNDIDVELQLQNKIIKIMTHKNCKLCSPNEDH